MAKTYSQLRDLALKMCDASGSSEAESVAEAALEETMSYLATKLELPALIKRANATWGSSTTSIAISTGGFNATDFQSPNRLFIAQTVDSYTEETPGIPYDFVEYMNWLDLMSIPNGINDPRIFESGAVDARPARAWTINLDEEVVVCPIAENNYLTLFYNTEPAAYTDNGYPEIPAQYSYILVNGAVLILKEYIREPEQIIDPRTLLRSLDDQIRELDIHKRSNRRNTILHVSHRYY